MSTVVATRFSDEVLAELDVGRAGAAPHARRGRAPGCRRSYLAEYADHQIALQRLSDPDDSLLTTQEMWKELGWGTPQPEPQE